MDVGARGGIHPRWKPYHSQLTVVGFEPDSGECAALNAKPHPYPIRYLPVALGAADGERATLYITKSPGCSSVLRPNAKLCNDYPYAPNMEIVRTQELTLQRLETVLDIQPDAMKIDTQGTELHVLQGAGKLLDRTIAVEIEVEFVEQYVGQPLFADIDAFMRSKGFTLRGLRRTYWRKNAVHLSAQGGQLIHGDALYLRMDRTNTPAGLTILAAYGQHDLLAAYGAVNLIPRSPRWKTLLGGFRANRELRRFVDSLRPVSATDWHDPDFF